MYIKNGDAKYPCSGRRQTGDTVVFSAAGVPEGIAGEIGLYADGGFELAVYDTADWLRVVVTAASLTLTNLPEPAPEPDPPEPGEPPVTVTLEDIVETVLDHEVRITAQEMGMTGG